uniref:RING-CH-type domain-containing protein n=1 Tax=Leersia perrieri TaxID=77586 RepID=A0A0D9XKR2_9ORYZ
MSTAAAAAGSEPGPPCAAEMVSEQPAEAQQQEEVVVVATASAAAAATEEAGAGVVTIVISQPEEAGEPKGVAEAVPPPAVEDGGGGGGSKAAAAAVKEVELVRSDSFDEQCRVCQQKTEEPLVDLGCRCRGDLSKAHHTQVAVNIPPPETQASGWFSPLWVAFAILIGGLLLDVLISVSLGVSALPVNIIIGVLIVLGLGTALRLALECCQEWGSRRRMPRLPMDGMAPSGYHPGYTSGRGRGNRGRGRRGRSGRLLPPNLVVSPPPFAAATTAAAAMISILAQERLLGFALGSISMGGFVLHQRRAIYRSLADADADAAAPSPVSYYQPSGVSSRRGSTELAHVWNKAVDETLGRLVTYLSSRGW